MTQEQTAETVEDELGNKDDASEGPDNWPNGGWKVYLSFVASVPLNAYRAWVLEGKTLPTAQMIDATVATVTAGSQTFEHCMAVR